MANAVLEGMKAAGAEAETFTSEQAEPQSSRTSTPSPSAAPAMVRRSRGDRICPDVRRGQRLPLRQGRGTSFGSYGWGDGEWMRTWEEDCKNSGLNLVCQSVTCCEASDDDALEACRKLGGELCGNLSPEYPRYTNTLPLCVPGILRLLIDKAPASG